MKKRSFSMVVVPLLMRPLTERYGALNASTLFVRVSEVRRKIPPSLWRNTEWSTLIDVTPVWPSMAKPSLPPKRVARTVSVPWSILTAEPLPAEASMLSQNEPRRMVTCVAPPLMASADPAPSVVLRVNVGWSSSTLPAVMRAPPPMGTDVVALLPMNEAFAMRVKRPATPAK
jgi:hypothetical protein